VNRQHDHFIVCAYIEAKAYVVFNSFFAITLSNVVRLLQNFAHSATDNAANLVTL